ncbi:MAG: tRNA (adenosine(37)-N6)-threonylcarbamoyltransferase complex ATPase subunit type 1 TsaE [Beduini sp.]|uniref:tRNA (adenosine(37)-N6)-threonylcarbamoyltransferase complex ATPase subunit type 1 TsaE n=1 Tax=Beduini sp. TaxID=1922300 RepID=UPI0039A24FDC
MYKVTVNSVEETNGIAIKLGRAIKKHTVILLTGDLGAGKTTFTKGIAKGLGVKEIVNSPTFTILKEYHSGRLPLYHFDAYRLEDGYEDLGFGEYIDSEALSVIEWPMYMQEDIPEEYLEINLQYVDEQTRTIEFVPHGFTYEALCKEVLA